MSRGMKWGSVDRGKSIQLEILRRKFARFRTSYNWLLRVRRRVFFLQGIDREFPLALLRGLMLGCERDLLQLEKERLELKVTGSLCL